MHALQQHVTASTFLWYSFASANVTSIAYISCSSVYFKHWMVVLSIYFISRRMTYFTFCLNRKFNSMISSMPDQAYLWTERSHCNGALWDLLKLSEAFYFLQAMLEGMYCNHTILDNRHVLGQSVINCKYWILVCFKDLLVGLPCFSFSSTTNLTTHISIHLK